MLDPKTIEELKQKLLAEKARLEKNMSGTEMKEQKTDREYQTKFPEIERNEEENADEIEMYESNLATDEALKEELKKVEAALARIVAGTYGTCQNCKEEIPLERLQVYPQANSCIKCKTSK